MRVRQPVQLVRQQRVGALPILLGQALQRRDDVPRQPRREPARPNRGRQDERRFPAERLLDALIGRTCTACSASSRMSITGPLHPDDVSISPSAIAAAISGRYCRNEAAATPYLLHLR